MSQIDNFDKELENFLVNEQKKVQEDELPLTEALFSTPFSDPIKQPELATRHPSPPMPFIAVPLVYQQSHCLVLDLFLH